MGGEKLMKPQQQRERTVGGGDLKAKLFYPEASGRRPLIRQNCFVVEYEDLYCKTLASKRK